MHCLTRNRLLSCLPAVLLVVGIMVYVSVLHERQAATQLSRRDATCRELQIFCYQLQAWCAIQGQGVLPGPELADAVAAIRGDPILKATVEQVCPHVLRGYDTWGRAFRYRLMADGQAAELISFGPNGRDDQGTSDDIVVRLDFDGHGFVVRMGSE